VRLSSKRCWQRCGATKSGRYLTNTHLPVGAFDLEKTVRGSR